MSAKGQKTAFFLLALVVVLLGVRPFFARHLPVRVFTSADGLGSSFVDYLTRDARGFMWFCTRDGLSRFDGSRFTTYTLGAAGSPPGFETIYQTRDGAYWVSTTGGTYRFDLAENAPPDSVKPRIDAEFVTPERGFFFEDAAGTLYTSSGPFSRIDKRDGKYVLTRVPLDLPVRENSALVISDFGETNDGSLWLNSNWGLIRRLPDGRVVYYPIESNFGGGGNTSMIVDRSGRIWVTLPSRLLVLKPEPPEAFAGEGALTIRAIDSTASVALTPEAGFALPKTSGEIVQFSSEAVDNFVENSYAKRIYQTSDGDVWVTAEDKLMQFSDGVFHLHSRTEGLPNVMARMQEDLAGNLWIGGQAGLARLDRRGLVTYGAADGARSTRFFAINEDPDGTVYAASRDFYINRFDGEKFEAVQPLIDPGAQFLWTSRFGLRTSGGDWWILTNKKLYLFSGLKTFADLDRRKASRTYTAADGLKADGMFQMFEDADGNLWLSTRGRGDDGNGLARLTKGAERFYNFSAADGLPPGKSASCFATDRDGNIWLGFYEGGLARFDGERFEFFDKEIGLPGGGITDLHVDGKGRLWIGSVIGGLLRIDGTSDKTPSLVAVTTAGGLASNNVRTLTEDRFGRLYVGTARGVDRLSPDTGRVKHYSVSDGLAADFVVDSHCDKTGNLWFATNDGLSRLVPLPDETAAAPRIFIGGLKIAGLEQPVSQLGNAELRQGELAHTENTFQIDFFGLDFRAGEILRYQYRLEGADADWSAPTEQRTVTFANLQPGGYRFLVRAVNSDGLASETPAVIAFRILPPVWARWWFRSLAALLVAGVAVLLYRYRISHLRKINAALTDAKQAEEKLRRSKEDRLAELEQVRSRIATDLHDDIGASLTQIAVLSEVARAQSRGNGASEPLSRISNVSNELVEAMSDIVWAINPQKDHLSDLTQRMRRFAADVLSAKGIAFRFDSAEADAAVIVNTNVRREVFMVFKESINNIVKHSDAAHAAIELKVADGHLLLKISDDGRGFAAAENGCPPSDFGGNGLASMKKRAREMNGRVEIISAAGEGTIIDLKLPLEQFAVA